MDGSALLQSWRRHRAAGAHLGVARAHSPPPPPPTTFQVLLLPLLWGLPASPSPIRVGRDLGAPGREAHGSDTLLAVGGQAGELVCTSLLHSLNNLGEEVAT